MNAWSWPNAHVTPQPEAFLRSATKQNGDSNHSASGTSWYGAINVCISLVNSGPANANANKATF